MNYQQENKELLYYFISQHKKLRLIVEPEDIDNLNALIQYIGTGAEEIELITHNLPKVLKIFEPLTAISSIQSLDILKYNLKNIHLKVIFPNKFSKLQLEYCIINKYEILSKYPNFELEQYYKPKYLIPTIGNQIINKNVDWYNEDFNKITIRVKDLKIFASPKIQDDLFSGGQYIIKNNKIVDLEPHNLSVFMTMVDMRHCKYPKCCVCKMVDQCPGDDIKLALESTGELFFPRKEFCKMFIKE